MASGDTLVVFGPQEGVPTATNEAELIQRNRHFLAAYDAATDEDMVFSGVMPAAYAGTTGITVTIIWAAATATANDVIWNAAIERLNDDAVDIDSDSFAAANASPAATAPSASGELSYDDITFTDGADMDSLVAEESFRIKITRDADNGSDDMAGDAQLWAVVITET